MNMIIIFVFDNTNIIYTIFTITATIIVIIMIVTFEDSDTPTQLSDPCLQQHAQEHRGLRRFSTTPQSSVFQMPNVSDLGVLNLFN